MPARLLACPSCARHVRVDEARCHFCSEVLPDDFGAGPVPVPPPAWLSRFERYFNPKRTGRLVGTLAGAAALAAATSNCAEAYGHGPMIGFPTDGGDASLDSESEAAENGDGDSDAESDAGDAAPGATPPSDAGDGG
jgi:hypothetical protein